MSDYVCPWCGCEVDEDDWWEIPENETFITECPNCERELRVSYYVEPVFSVTMPEELDACADCRAWDGIEDCCAWLDKAKIAEWNHRRAIWGDRKNIRPMNGCPLGHDKEDDNG